MKRDYDSPLLGYRKRNTGEIKNFVQSTWIGLDYKGKGMFDQLGDTLSAEGDLIEQYRKKDIDFFIYENNLSNNYLNRFEDISAVNKQGTTIYLDKEASISEFIAKNYVNGVNPGTNSFIGAFLCFRLTKKMASYEFPINKYHQKKHIPHTPINAVCPL